MLNDHISGKAALGLFEVKDNLFYAHGKIYIPNDPELKKDLMWEAHDCKLAGHGGQKRSYDKLHQHYMWPKMKDDVPVVASMRAGNTMRRRGMPALFSFLLLLLLLYVDIATATRLPGFDHHFARQLVATGGPAISPFALMGSSSTSSAADMRIIKLAHPTTDGRPGPPGSSCC
ncbi:hypothetical protein GOP47_0025000 [Adiantum capillus-veneris]|uniref:Integrase zinc-binding domain-containing protein n=1 Tax=Adiantum capillus-veneris TaxID=13818 RepID=A0A9D4Z457_ADICA|nr:hypothetical protein GOP47_0025000 [Adiantum capillus-veneris]